MNPKEFRAGDLLNPNDGYSYLHFIERVEPRGVWIELVYHPKPYESRGEIVTNYSKNSGHGCLIEHRFTLTPEICRAHYSSDFWRKHTKVGFLPRLIGERSLTLTVPM